MQKRGQASFEFLTIYVWVLMTVLITIGIMFYFNVFDPNKYINEECQFGQNIICEDWVLDKRTSGTFNIKLKLKNNLEKPITAVNISIYDQHLDLVNCSRYTIVCPFNSVDINWTAGFYGNFSDVGDSTWKQGMSCKLDAKNCLGIVVDNTKGEFSIKFTFRRKSGRINHTINGRLLANVQ